MEVHSDNNNIITESQIILDKTQDNIKTPMRKIERMQEVYLKKRNNLYSDMQIKKIWKSFETVRQKYVFLDFHLEQLWSLSMKSRQKLHHIFENSLDNLEWDDQKKVIGILFLESFLFQAKSFLDVYLFHACLILRIDNPGYMSVDKFYKHLDAITHQDFIDKAELVKQHYQTKVFGDDHWGEILRSLRDKIAHKDCLHPSYEGKETIWGNVLLNWPSLHGLTLERFCQEIIKNGIFEMMIETSMIFFELEWKSGAYKSDLWD